MLKLYFFLLFFIITCGQATLAQNATPRFQPEVQEIKKSLPLRKVDETKSEFERSRQASKTWSMGQD